MCDLFFAHDGQNYARYLTFFAVFMENIEENHPNAEALLKRGAISVAKSFIPGNRCAVDKTIEETLMKNAKSRDGMGSGGTRLSEINTNYNAYQRWVKTLHQQTLYATATFHMADMLTESNEGDKHKDLRPSEIRRSEKCVQNATEAIKGFLNPFNVDDREKVYCLSSGAPSTDEIEDEVLCAWKAGEDAKELFITERLMKKQDFLSLSPE